MTVRPDAFDHHSAGAALVTGASSGIGEAIATALAERGSPHLVLVARDRDRLEAAASALRDRHGAHVDVVVADLSTRDGPGDVFAETERLGISVGLLVNGAGVASQGPFEAADGPIADELVCTNVLAMTTLTRLYLPAMLRRGRGGIINVASNAAYIPVPYSAAYVASKAYVLSLSEALWVENRHRGVRVVAVVPGVTRTNLAGPGQGETRPGLTVSVSEPHEVASVALGLLDRNQASGVVGGRNLMVAAVSRVMPRRLAAEVLGSLKRPASRPTAEAPFPLMGVALMSLAGVSAISLGVGAVRRRASKVRL